MASSRILCRGKWDIVAALRLREAEERCRVIQRIADNFTPSPPGVCTHCGEGARVADPFVLLFANDDRADIHSSCHSAWWAKREAEARSALGLGIRPMAGIALASNSTTSSPMMRRRTGKTNDMTAGSRRLCRMPDKRRSGQSRRGLSQEKEGHSRDSASGPRTAPTDLQSQQ